MEKEDLRNRGKLDNLVSFIYLFILKNRSRPVFFVSWVLDFQFSPMFVYFLGLIKAEVDFIPKRMRSKNIGYV